LRRNSLDEKSTDPKTKMDLIVKHRPKTTSRNRGLIARFEAGESVELLMVLYGLSKNRVRAVLADERNRRLSSPDPFYRNLRTVVTAFDP
jgi:hypothetical protein